jgi:hypothetical protein
MHVSKNIIHMIAEKRDIFKASFFESIPLNVYVDALENMPVGKN